MVQDIIKITGAEVFKACRYVKTAEDLTPEAIHRAKTKRKGYGDGAKGCSLSHMTILKKNPNEPCLIFEDDCIITDPNILDIIDRNYATYDLIYLGVLWSWNENGHQKSYGTHAMWVSPKARKAILDKYQKNNNKYTMPIDNFWNQIQVEYNLKVWRPIPPNGHCRQHGGVPSTINKFLPPPDPTLEPKPKPKLVSFRHR
jgi:GR25 family glycosyltransferase involved in LPS biosynthesis